MAIDKLTVMSAQSDLELLKAEADAHRRAIGSISGPNGITSKVHWDGVTAALNSGCAPVLESTIMDCTMWCH